MNSVDGKGLGRLHLSDDRDRLFPMRPHLRALEENLSPWQEKKLASGINNWRSGDPYLDQADTPHCVGFAWAQYLNASPVMNRCGEVDAHSIYFDAQKVDDFPGEDYEGTTVRAGAKVLQDRGYLSEYRWAASIDDIVRALLIAGPVVVGTEWFAGMHRPELVGKGSSAYHRMRATGADLGGHAWLLVGVNKRRGMIRMKNSWGREWADAGRAWIPIDDVAELLALDGEAALAVEVKKK